MNVLITETDAGIISFFAPSSTEEWSAQHDTRDEFLLATEQYFISQGKVTHGLIDEADIPEGGLKSDLYWDYDSGALAYGDTQLKKSLLNQRDALLDSSNTDLVLAMEKYRYGDGTDNYRLISQDPSMLLWKTYRNALRDLDDAIEADPSTVVFPEAPVVTEVTLSDYKKNKINELQMGFNDELGAGLISAALGADHKYDLDPYNIAWVLACTSLTLTSTQTPSITCDDLLGNEQSKAQRPHTGEECAELLSDCMGLIQAMKDKLAGLKTEVNDAADEAEVDLVVWS